MTSQTTQIILGGALLGSIVYLAIKVRNSAKVAPADRQQKILDGIKPSIFEFPIGLKENNPNKLTTGVLHFNEDRRGLMSLLTSPKFVPLGIIPKKQWSPTEAKVAFTKL